MNGVLIDGVVELKEGLDPDQFTDDFIVWIESKGLSFGGGFTPIDVDADPEPEEPKTFAKELEHLINRMSVETGSSTPDFILAQYLISCLTAYEEAVKARQAHFTGTFKNPA